MRVFQVLAAAATGGVSSSNIWLRNLHEPLLDLGHEVFLFRAEEGYAARNDAAKRARFSQKILDAFRAEHKKKPFDLFFAYLMDGMVESGAIDEIKKSGVPTCNFSCNNTHQFDLVQTLSPHFDFNLHSEKDAAEKFRSIGANPVWFPMAANPRYYHPYDMPREYDVTFVGQNYANRHNYIWNLLEHSINMHVYGSGWRLRDESSKRKMLRFFKRMNYALKALLPRDVDKQIRASTQLADLDFRERLRKKYSGNLHYPLSDDEMIRMYSRSAVSLGFLEVYDGHNPDSQIKRHLHLRDFEAPMCGALYLTGWCDELAEFFEPGREVLVYRNEFEMLEIIRYFLSHEREADEIRKCGYDRAVKEHTYQKRFADLFPRIGL